MSWQKSPYSLFWKNCFWKEMSVITPFQVIRIILWLNFLGTQGPKKIQTICFVWCMMVQSKSVAMPFHTRDVLATIESFQMIFCMKFYIKGIRNTSYNTFGFPNFPYKIHFWGNFWFWLLVILIPLETKIQTVPHLKALIIG